MLLTFLPFKTTKIAIAFRKRPNHNRAVSIVSGDEYVCPFLFDFLTIGELGRAAAVCHAWKASACDDELWKDMYERTQVNGERGVASYVAVSTREFTVSVGTV